MNRVQPDLKANFHCLGIGQKNTMHKRNIYLISPANSRLYSAIALFYQS